MSNATRSLEEATRLDPGHVMSHLLLAKIRIGQGLHELALAALDAAARAQPDHWQTHLMRLHCLRALGRLHSPEAEHAHEHVCHTIRRACIDAGAPDVYSTLCAADAIDATGARVRRPRVRLLDHQETHDAHEPSASVAAPAATDGASGALARMARGLYGAHLHSESARRKLRRDRYVVLRKLLPKGVLRLLQRWYAKLDESLESSAQFQEKTRRHEYLPEVGL